MRAVARLAVPAWALVLTLVLVSPMGLSGHLLGGDLVITPRQPLTLAALGLSSAPPRAVPLDGLLALAETVVDGGLLGRFLIGGLLVVAGTGAAALLRGASLPARLAACTAAVWCPFVVERLALGQWALLWSAAALPWVLRAVQDLGDARARRGWVLLVLALAAGSVTPTGGVVVAVSAVVAAAVLRPRREALVVAGLAVVLQLPWVVPSLVSTATPTSDPAAVAAFAARGEQGGVLTTLLTGGGVWDAAVVPASRTGPLAWAALALLVVAAVAGAAPLRRLVGARPLTVVVVLAAGGFVLALLPAVPGGRQLVEALVRDVPGAGLLRDSQKWLVPFVLLQALLVGAAVERLRGVRLPVAWRGVVAAAAVLASVVLLPDARATVAPTLRPVRIPSAWTVVAEQIRAAGGGDAAVVPWGSYRRFAWAPTPPGRSVADPASRLLPVPVVGDDRLVVGDRVLEGEDPRAARVARALGGADGTGTADPRALAAAGVRWVVVERGTPGRVPDLSRLQPRLVGDRAGGVVELYRVPGTVAADGPSTVRTVLVLVADALAALVVLGAAAAGAAGAAAGVVGAVRGRRRERRATAR